MVGECALGSYSHTREEGSPRPPAFTLSRNGARDCAAAPVSRARRAGKLRAWRNGSGSSRAGATAPGLNAVIRAVTRRSLARRPRGRRTRGLGGARPRAPRSRSGRARCPGCFRAAERSSARRGRIRTSSTAASRRCSRRSRERLDALVAIGGEDTLGVAARLHDEHDFPVVGVPKTIDNDLSATDYTFGFDTAVSICTEAIDRLHTTAESHNRVMVVEVMGRHTGWIAVHERDRRRRRRDPDPRAAGHRRAGMPRPPAAPRARQGLLDRRRQRGVRAHVRDGRAHDGHAGRARPTRSATYAWAASATRSRARSRSAPATRRASPCSATSSAAGRRRRATACWRRATG